MKISSDYKDLLRSLNAAGVRYLVVGGYAVTIYTEPRFTKDLDIWTDPTIENARALFRALSDGAPLKGISPRDFTEPEIFYQMGVEPVRVDVLTSLPGLTFGEAWDRRQAVDFDGEQAFVVGREDLVLWKKLTARAIGSMRGGFRSRRRAIEKRQRRLLGLQVGPRKRAVGRAAGTGCGRSGRISTGLSAVGFEAMADAEDAHGSWAIQGADIGVRFIEPLDSVERHLPGVVRGEREIFRLYAELGEEIIHGSAAVLRRPRPSVVKAAAAVPGYGFIVGWSRGQGAGNGIDHHFEQMARGGELAGIELVQQPMGMLFMLRAPPQGVLHSKRTRE